LLLQVEFALDAVECLIVDFALVTQLYYGVVRGF